MDDRVRQVLERVARGVFMHRTTGIGVLSQCQFCGNAPENGHEPKCLTEIARGLMTEEALRHEDRRRFGMYKDAHGDWHLNTTQKEDGDG